MKSSWWKTALKYAIGFVVLAWVVHSNWNPTPDLPGSGLKGAFERPMRIGPFLIAGLLCAINVFQTFVRWFLLVRAQKLPFTLRKAIRLGLVGYFFNTFLPGSVGGDLIKAAAIAREQERRTVAVATVLIDRAVGLVGLIALVATVGGAFWAMGADIFTVQPELKSVVRTAIGLAVGVATAWGLLGLLPERRAVRFAGRLEWLPRIGRMLAEVWRAVWMYRQTSGTVALALALAMAGHTCSVLMFYFAAATFHSADDPTAMPPLATHFLIVPIGMAVQAFIPAPGGVGGGELVFGGLYRLTGYPEANGILGSLGQRVWSWLLGAMGYIAYLVMKREGPITSLPIAPQPASSDRPADTSSAPRA